MKMLEMTVIVQFQGTNLFLCSLRCHFKVTLPGMVANLVGYPTVIRVVGRVLKAYLYLAEGPRLKPHSFLFLGVLCVSMQQ